MKDARGQTIDVGDVVRRAGYGKQYAKSFIVLAVYPTRIKINKETWAQDYTFVRSNLMILDQMKTISP
jgi:hypothetical protein